MQRRNAFTLIEIALSIFILLLILLMAVPSLSGVNADKRLRRSLDDLNGLVRQAQERSIAERRAYLIVWGDDYLELRPEAFAPDEEVAPTAQVTLRRGDAFVLTLPAALQEDPPPAWIFWPSGTCEPATVSFKGVDGSWTAKYSALTGRPEIADYVAK